MNDEQLLRYARHIMLPDIDIEGQEKLLASRVLIVGLGGLGSPVSLYLAASGVGTLVLADFDTVDLSNLQRQVVHRTRSVGKPKVESARELLNEINPDIRIETISERLTLDQLDREVAASDLVIDCTDNFDVRFAINDACLKARTRLVSGAAVRMEGQLMVIDPQDPDSPCYRCLYQDASDEALNCAETGIAAPVVGTIGTLQATEALKLITGAGEPLVGYLLTWDARYMDWRKLKLPKNPDCLSCGPAAVAPS